MTGGGQIRNALHLSSIIKSFSSKTKIVFGGPHVNVLPEETLKNQYIDAVLFGPGQNSFPLFIRALINNAEYQNVPGLIMKINNELLYGIENNLSNQDLLPYCFDFVDICQYIQKDSTIADRTVNYISTQGCAFSCRFCYENN
jgi:radical SAM superfamily enzyme YgiQ (UPF0313 family)